MLTHAQAKEIADDLGFGPIRSLFLRAVSFHETNYGGGWKPENVTWYGPAISWHPGINAPWNMGAITTEHPDSLSFSHKDSKFDDAAGQVVQYRTWFAGDPSAATGFARLGTLLFKFQETRDALELNDILGAIAGMYDQHYFLGLHTHANPNGDRLNIEDYYAAIVKAIEAIGRETGETQPDVLPPKGVA